VSDVSIDANLGWNAGSDTDSHDVYFGTNSPPAPLGNQTLTSYDLGTLSNSTTYFWRIDEVNATGTTMGAEWSFTTVSAPTGTMVHIDTLTGSSTPGSRNRWTVSVQIDVMDQDTAPIAGVVVDSSWSNGASGGASCTTNASGQCSVSKSNLKANVASVVFGVDNLSGSDVSYASGANAVSQVTVFKDGGGGNLLPNAINDNYTTNFEQPVSGNVLDNDDEGDAPATVTSYDSTSVQGVSISVSAGGDFSYTPPADYAGGDSFSYTITDSNGDSDSAAVSITVNSDTGGGLVLSVSKSRAKGAWFSDLIWSGGTGTEQVTITRGGVLVSGSPTANDGAFSEPMGKKVSGSYIYEVCEPNSDICASDTVSF
jgi:hypothetical protein